MFQLLKILLWPFRAVMKVLILAYDRLLAPAPMQRPAEKQRLVDQETAQLALYHFEACPFCVKVRRHIRRLGLKIEMRDVKINRAFDKELVQGGGKFQVPCLRISKPGSADQWMYESSEINAYLNSRFA